MIESEIMEINTKALENELFEKFGDKYLEDIIRVVNTREFGAKDIPMVVESLAIVLTLYMNKVRDGELNRNKVKH